MITINFVRLDERAKMPVKANATDAGYDLYALEDGVVQPGERKLFRTGISIAIAFPLYGRIAPRSGLAVKHGIDVLAGVVDSGYRGDVGVLLYNTSNVPFEVTSGMRIAQLIFELAFDPKLVEVGQPSDLEASDRGAAGFGSSGV